MESVRYNLDSLGWYQFEWLIQVLLKSELGMGIESWGTRGDHGRDVFSNGPLRFPARDIESDGPFVFQVKFLEGANVRGAKLDAPLIAACRAELRRILKRIKEKSWSDPAYYTLLTNAPLSAEVRLLIESTFREATAAKVTTLGGQDVSDLLDKNPGITRMFPQILSLRNLRELLEDIVNKETVQRSHAALLMVKDLVNVFVPTGAYNEAWRTLAKHYFAVLEGPPEMGKTAIAWMIAVAQVANGWDAVACDDPADFFRSHRLDTAQIFVADDAFGRTEYDPTMGSKWEKQIGRVKIMLDAKHWLIWTSRRHILERARREMDLQGEAEDFPKPADVLVTASHLSVEEKALMLYRHAKAAKLVNGAKALVKNNVRQIVSDPNFTPERIRRFVSESLPQLAKNSASGKTAASALQVAIKEAIRNPTERMAKTFRALPQEHKWLLIALLEQGHSPEVGLLRARFSHLCQGVSTGIFDRVLEELSEAFVKYEHPRLYPVS